METSSPKWFSRKLREFWVQAVEEVNTIAESSAGGMEQASSSMEELSDQIRQIARLIQKLKQSGTELS